MTQQIFGCPRMVRWYKAFGRMGPRKILREGMHIVVGKSHHFCIQYTICAWYISFSLQNWLFLITIFSQPENHVFLCFFPFFPYKKGNHVIGSRFRSKVEDFSQVGHRTHHSYCRYLGFWSAGRWKRKLWFLVGWEALIKVSCNGGDHTKRWMSYVYNFCGYIIIVV